MWICVYIICMYNLNWVILHAVPESDFQLTVQTDHEGIIHIRCNVYNISPEPQLSVMWVFLPILKILQSVYCMRFSEYVHAFRLQYITAVSWRSAACGKIDGCLIASSWNQWFSFQNRLALSLMIQSHIYIDVMHVLIV